MTDKFATTIKTYNTHANQFVQMFEAKIDIEMLEEFSSLMPKAGKILDAGCGSARDAAYFINKGFLAQGIDVSEGLLIEAKKLHPEVPTQLMSLTDINLANETFNGVWCKAALLHLDRKDIPKVLSSFYRILKANGCLFIQTKAGEGEGNEPTPFNPSIERFFTYFTLEEMSGLVQKAGFIILNQYTFNGRQRNEKSRDMNWLIVLGKKL